MAPPPPQPRLQSSFSEFLLLNATSYDIAHPFFQFGSTALTLFTSSLLTTSTPLLLGASGWEGTEGLDTVQALVISSQNIAVISPGLATHWKHSIIQANLKKANSKLYPIKTHYTEMQWAIYTENIEPVLWNRWEVELQLTFLLKTLIWIFISCPIICGFPNIHRNFKSSEILSLVWNYWMDRVVTK